MIEPALELHGFVPARSTAGLAEATTSSCSALDEGQPDRDSRLRRPWATVPTVTRTIASSGPISRHAAWALSSAIQTALIRGGSGRPHRSRRGCVSRSGKAGGIVKPGGCAFRPAEQRPFCDAGKCSTRTVRGTTTKGIIGCRVPRMPQCVFIIRTQGRSPLGGGRLPIGGLMRAPRTAPGLGMDLPEKGPRGRAHSAAPYSRISPELPLDPAEDGGDPPGGSRAGSGIPSSASRSAGARPSTAA